MKIGLFDSGLGGLTIMRGVTETLPQYDYVYYGDTANVPYGNKSEEEIRTLTTKGIQTLFEKDCLLVIIACNTASAETLRNLQDEWLPNHYGNRRILGVIVPTVEALIETGKQDVLLIGTKRTVDSKKYERELASRSTGVRLTGIATPELVPAIEAGDIASAQAIAVQYIGTEGGKSEVVILGCTHYTEIKDEVRNKFHDKIILSQDEIIPAKLATYLDKHPEITSRLSSGRGRDIILTEERPDYVRLIKTFLR